MTSITDEELRAARELCERATPGPWECESHDLLDSPGCSRVISPTQLPHAICAYAETRDAVFIASSRTLVPRLLEEIERRRADCAQLDAIGVSANDACEVVSRLHRFIDDLGSDVTRLKERSIAWQAQEAAVVNWIERMRSSGYPTDVLQFFESLDELEGSLAHAGKIIERLKGDPT